MSGPRINRREVLGTGLATAGALAGAGCRPGVPAPAPGQWSNWSGSEMSRPAEWLAPTDESGVVAGVRAARGTVRVTGAGHSFSPLCSTDDVLLSLDELAGVVSYDASLDQANVWAGTRLHDLGEPLWAIGQALVNQGDIDPQSVGGACGTSTHGTGVTLGSFSSALRGVRLVTGEGEIVEAGPERDEDVFHAACTSLGAVGILTQAILQNRPRYNLREEERVVGLRRVLDSLDSLIEENRHFEFWCFFAHDEAIVKTLNETEAGPTLPPLFDPPMHTVLEGVARVAEAAPPLASSMQWLLATLQFDGHRIGRSFEIFPSPRKVRFNEMEYEVPLDRGPECLLEILDAVRRSDVNTLFPIEYRTVAADDCWLSPFYGRASASISVHQYFRADYRPLFSLVEPIFRRYGGRPHWGKIHSLQAQDLAELYPRWEAFQEVRRRLDPKGRFLNPYLETILGVNA